MISIQRSPASKAFYDGKRAQGKRHTQAVLALARRSVNVLWAMLRDHQPYQERDRRSSSPLDKRIENHVPSTTRIGNRIHPYFPGYVSPSDQDRLSHGLIPQEKEP